MEARDQIVEVRWEAEEKIDEAHHSAMESFKALEDFKWELARTVDSFKALEEYYNAQVKTKEF